MRNLLLAVSFLACINLYSREIYTIVPDELKNSELKLSQNCLFEIENSNFILNNLEVTNHSSLKATDLSLELLLTEDFPSNKIDGFPISSLDLTDIEKHSSLSQAKVNFEKNTLPVNGIYYVILILKKGNQIQDFVAIDKNLSVSDHQLLLNNTPNRNAEFYQPVKLISVNDNSVVLENDWEIKIDAREFKVQLSGGDIVNHSQKDVEHLKLDVFLVKDINKNFTQDFQGLRIASIPIDYSILAGDKLSNVDIKTNLKIAFPAGNQHILVTVSEIGEDGNSYLKSYKYIGEFFN